MLNEAEALALVEGHHPDPFAILGPHWGQGCWQVTAFVPGAERLWLLKDDGSASFAAKLWGGLAGLFTCDLSPADASASAPPSYRLRAEAGGHIWEFDDPFRFGPLLQELDIHLLAEGTYQRLWQALGAHPLVHQGVAGVHFALWAPNALRVAVVGDFNAWDGRRHPMRRLGGSGIWEIFIPGLTEGARYKYEIHAANGQLLALKADPLGFGSEHPPANASLVRDLTKPKADGGAWLGQRGEKNGIKAPISIYEVHLGSWRRAPGDRMLSYTELADQLISYVADMGFTHIELLPISEHPFDGSWGYQPIGLYAPTIRHGTPDEFRELVAAAHRNGLGVILDWVPGHFPSDAHGLARFDGTPLYEHADPREGFHQDWNTLIFDYGRAGVQNYITSNALYWLEEYQLDGLRVDAVASMLYRDYSRQPGEWIPNRDGGRENYEAIAMLRAMNTLVYRECPGILTAAEEPTSFPAVSRPVDQGGLGFGFKWNMGWMNDTLAYMALDPVYRQYHHNKMTFGLMYAWSENFILPLSHDEVVHAKGSLLAKMPGEGAERFANLRAFYGFMWGHPGKKLLFMGQEFAQSREWSHMRSLDWHQLEDPLHRGMQSFVRDLNQIYRNTPALYCNDAQPEGFAWILADAADISVFAWERHGGPGDAPVVVVVNMTPVLRRLRIGLPLPGLWAEVLNSDALDYGGSGAGNWGEVGAEDVPSHGRAQSAELTLPGLSVIWLKPAERAPQKTKRRPKIKGQEDPL